MYMDVDGGLVIALAMYRRYQAYAYVFIFI